MRVIFMGTPDFAVPVLTSLLEGGHEVVAVVTQPDKPKGRKNELQFPPVKEEALRHEIPVLQPVRVREPAVVEELAGYEPEVIVVAAFGQILPPAILSLPRYGCVNVHASLLPKYRGAAPIQWAVIDGEEKTGITIMQMDEGLDTGDILATEELLLDREETGGSLFEKLAAMGGPLLLRVLTQLEEGSVRPISQGKHFSYAPMLRKETGRIDWERPAVEIERMVRGLSPWPSAYTQLNGKTLKIWRAELAPEKEVHPVGEIFAEGQSGLFVQTGCGVLSLLEVQLEGKKRMTAADFLRGYRPR